MNDIEFYLHDENQNTRDKLNRLTFPCQFTDVMDGSWDTGSISFILTLEEYNAYKDKRILREGGIIERIIYNENSTIIDDRIFEIQEYSADKDSIYNENDIAITVKYVEMTETLTNLMMPNFTYSIDPRKFSNLDTTKKVNSMYDVFDKAYNIIDERNASSFKNHRYFSIDNKLKEKMLKYPSSNKTYLDSNFYDIAKDLFSTFSSVPYFDSLNKKLTYISSMGNDTSKKIVNDKNRFVILSNYNRDKASNGDVVENKAVNIMLDNEFLWYPENINLDSVGQHMDVEKLKGGYYVRPKGLNEGLQQYQDWWNWYLELPYNIDTIEKVYCLEIYAVLDYNKPQLTRFENKFTDVTDRIIEDTSFKGLTETEKKYYSHYKKGSNRIESIVVSAGITLEDNNWPWEKNKDNNRARRVMFAVKYKPVLDTDITVVKNGKNIDNKKNIVLNSKSISDTDLLSQTKYQLEKNYYGQYMLEIAGEYQNIQASDIVEIDGFESYGIPSKKYLISKVDTTFEKEGSHQVIYFNELVARNNVLLNEDNLVRISQNPSYEPVINRIYKKTDAIGLKPTLVDNTTASNSIIEDTVASKQFIYQSLASILTPQYVNETYLPESNRLIKGGVLEYQVYNVDRNLNVGAIERHFLEGALSTLNSGVVSQAIIKAINNNIWDNDYDDSGFNINNESIQNYVLKASIPKRYTDYTGRTETVKIYFDSEEAKSESSSGNNFPSLSDKFLNFYKPLFGMQFGSKDIREILCGVYEQSWYGDNDNIQLSDFFTSCTSSFGKENSTQMISVGKKLSKDILIFNKKIYNVNSIDENSASITIPEDKYSEYVTWNSTCTSLFIKVGSGLSIGQNIGDKAIVIRGVLRSVLENGALKYQIKVPQLLINIPAHKAIGTSEYIRLDVIAKKL